MKRKAARHHMCCVCADKVKCMVLICRLSCYLLIWTWDKTTFNLQWQQSTATCSVLLRSAWYPIAWSKIKETSVWILFSLLRKKASIWLWYVIRCKSSVSVWKTCKCFPDIRYTWKLATKPSGNVRCAWLPGQQCFSVEHCSIQVKCTDITGKNTKNLEYWWFSLWTLDQVNY